MINDSQIELPRKRCKSICENRLGLSFKYYTFRTCRHLQGGEMIIASFKMVLNEVFGLNETGNGVH